MSSVSNYLETKILDHILGITPYVPPDQLYLALFDENATEITLEQGLLTGEPVGNNYTRKLVNFNAAVDNQSTNISVVEFNQASGLWNTITYAAVMDAFTGGNVLLHAPVGTARLINTGDTFRFVPDNLAVTIT